MAYGAVNQILTLSLPESEYPTMDAGETVTANGDVFMVFARN